MRLVGLFTDDSMIRLVLGHGEHPDAVLYRTGWIVGRPLRAGCRDGDAMVTLEVRPISPTDTPPVGRMIIYKEPRADEVPLICQRVGVYGTVLSERGLLGTVMSRFTGVPRAWNLSGGGLDAGKEPTAGLLREIHEETGQWVVPGWLSILQSNHWIGHTLNGELEDYHVLYVIYSATYEKPSCPHIHDLGGSVVRADWILVKSWHRIPWTQAARQVLNQHLPSR